MMDIRKCRDCGAEIVFLKTAAGKTMPILASSVEEGDVLFDHKKHKSHFADCPAAAKFRKPKEKK